MRYAAIAANRSTEEAGPMPSRPYLDSRSERVVVPLKNAGLADVLDDPPWRQGLVGVVLLAAASVLICGQWALYDATPVSQQNRARALLAAAVLAVAGVRLLLEPRGDHLIGVRASMLAAAALVLFALLATHDRASALVTECLCGVGALVASLVALPRVEPPRR